MSIVELLNFSYSLLLKDADPDGRKRIIAALEGRLGPGGGIIIDDPDLPAALQGKEAPAWWTPDHDPFKDTFTVG